MFFLIFNLANAGEIITAFEFSQIEKEFHNLDDNSLVLFDVDATLIVHDDALLKPQGKKLFKQLIANYPNKDLYREIRLHASHCLVDQRSVQNVLMLQQKKVPVIASTSAQALIPGTEAVPGSWRVEELKGYGLDFSSAFSLKNYF